MLDVSWRSLHASRGGPVDSVPADIDRTLAEPSAQGDVCHAMMRG